MLRCCLTSNESNLLPSSVEARSWDSSLDKLLQSSYGTALFRAFLQKEYAEENLDFVLRVERYRESMPKKREREAWKIYRTYIIIGAPHELNLDILSRKETEQLVEQLLIHLLNSVIPGALLNRKTKDVDETASEEITKIPCKSYDNSENCKDAILSNGEPKKTVARDKNSQEKVLDINFIECSTDTKCFKNSSSVDILTKDSAHMSEGRCIDILKDEATAEDMDEDPLSDYSPIPALQTQDDIADWFTEDMPSFSPGEQSQNQESMCDLSDSIPSYYETSNTDGINRSVFITQALHINKLSQSQSSLSSPSSQTFRSWEENWSAPTPAKRICSDRDNCLITEEDSNYTCKKSLFSTKIDSCDDIVPDITDALEQNDADNICSFYNTEYKKEHVALDQEQNKLICEEVDSKQNVEKRKDFDFDLSSSKTPRPTLRLVESQPHKVYWSQVCKEDQDGKVTKFIRQVGHLSRLQAKEMVKNDITSNNVHNDCKATNDAKEIEPFANVPLVNISETSFQPKLSEHDKVLTNEKTFNDIPSVFQSMKFNPPSSIKNFDKKVEISKENPKKVANEREMEIESTERKNEVECVDDQEEADRNFLRLGLSKRSSSKLIIYEDIQPEE